MLVYTFLTIHRACIIDVLSTWDRLLSKRSDHMIMLLLGISGSPRQIRSAWCGWSDPIRAKVQSRGSTEADTFGRICRAEKAICHTLITHLTRIDPCSRGLLKTKFRRLFQPVFGFVEYRFYYKCWCAGLRPPTIRAKYFLAYNA
jgi:hypothetical protein